MFRFLAVALLFFGVGALAFGGAEGAGAAGWLVFAPIIILFKVMFFMFLFAMISKMFWYRGAAPGQRPTRSDYRSGRRNEFRNDWARQWKAHRSSHEKADDVKSENDRFEEWHAMFHARKEVDSWTSDLPDPDESA